MMTNQIPVAGSAREASFTKRTKFDDKHESEHVDGVHGVLRGLLGEDDEDYIMMMMAVMIRLFKHLLHLPLWEDGGNEEDYQLVQI